MNLSRRVLLILLLLPFGPLARGAAADDPQTLEFTVDGTTRTALVHVPPDAAAGGKLPLVFVFHGHGGGSRNALHTFGFDRLWPEAVSVYPQGLNTPGRLTDPEGRLPGWQAAVGDQGDRDLHFFDAMLARLQKDFPVDPAQVYVTGHSNGGGFTYLLWLARPTILAAVAPCAGAALYAAQLPPKPAMILAGRRDPLVKYEWTQRMIDAVRRVNGCGDTAGAPWQGVGTVYASRGGTPLVTFIHDGGHMIDPAEPGLIVKFFQEHPGAPGTR